MSEQKTQEKSVLLVATSADDLKGHSTGAWLEEVAAPYYVFTGAGYSVTIASPKGGKIPVDAASLSGDFNTEACQKFVKDEAASKAFANSQKLSDDLAKSHDIVFFAGGHGTCTDFPEQGHVATAAWEAGKVVAAVCHGPMVLANCGSFVKGKKVTGFSNTEETAVGLQDKTPFLLEDKLKEIGGSYSKVGDWGVHAVADGRLVTGQNPGSSEKCAQLAVEAHASA